VNRIARLVIRLYPASWRERYGAELEALMQDSGAGWRAVLDLTRAALTMRLLGTFSSPSWSRSMVAGGLLGAVVGSLVFLATPPRLASSMSIAIQGEEGSQTLPLTVVASAFSEEKLQGLVKTFGLYPGPQNHEPSDAVRRFRADIFVTLTEPEGPARTEQVNIGERLVRFSDRGVLHVSFRYPDERKAQTVTGELARLIVDENLRASEAEGRRGASTVGERFRVTIPPHRIVVSRSAVQPVGLGLAIGALAGIGLATRRRRSLNPSATN
jgi:hypothetical protein